MHSVTGYASTLNHPIWSEAFRLSSSIFCASPGSKDVVPPSARQQNATRMAFRYRADGGTLAVVAELSFDDRLINDFLL